MESTRYLIVGGGMTGDAAVKEIRQHDADGPIILVGAEQHPPYARPPLTKGLWAGADEAKIWRGTEKTGALLQLGRRIVSLDLDGHRATDDLGEEYGWEKLLLATGGRPRTIPAAEGVVYFRTLDDYRAVRARMHEGASAIVIGGGFIGSELAASLAANGYRVTMVFPERGIASRVLPAELSAYVTEEYRTRGVEVLTEESVAAAGASWVTTGSGRTLEADVVAAGLGLEPATELATAAGLEVANGIVVDELGRAAGCDDVFAAGDVASFPVASLGRRFRVEHEDHAKSHGRVVGANMAGADVAYNHLPFFYSDMFELGYEAVGEVDSRLDTVESWEEPNRKGIVAYVDASRRPRGFLYWNVWDHVEAGRGLIAAGAPIQDAALV
ncbi:MAG TPA: FAD-dependent oxidoreductase [Gaiellaceae bacterium]|nr:FAD-dependent oxidoreductase [Gaiellaceae bacterium]